MSKRRSHQRLSSPSSNLVQCGCKWATLAVAAVGDGVGDGDVPDCGWEWDFVCVSVCMLLHDVFVCCAGYAKHVRIERDKNVKATRRDAEI